MVIVRDGIQLCDDCMIAAVNGDFTGLDYHYTRSKADERQAEIEAGLERLGPHLVMATTEGEHACDEFSVHPCDCCGTRLFGRRSYFAILGEG